MKIFKSKSWDIFTISASFLVLFNFILSTQVSSYIEMFEYSWERNLILNSPSLKVYASSRSPRKSFSKNYYLNIYQNNEKFAEVSCGMTLENYCKSLLDITNGLPIQNLKYETGTSPSKSNIIYLINSFEIINHNRIKKIENFTDGSSKKKNSIIFIGIAGLPYAITQIWIIRKWFLTNKKDFNQSQKWEYWLIKLGLPALSVVIPFYVFLDIYSLW